MSSNPGEQLSALRDVLRHLDHPERLRMNALAARHFNGSSNPATSAARLKCLIEQRVAELPPRQREIVRRCDLHGEPHPAVISSLAISERHFYRERQSAFQALSSALGSVAYVPLSGPVASAHDALALQVCFADAAHQVGDISRAVEVLRNASRDTVDPGTRIHLECRLAEFCSEAGTETEARSHVEAARALSSLVSETKEAFAAQIDAVEGMVDWRGGRADIAVQRSQRAVFALRPVIGHHAAPRDAEGLALALLVLSEKDFALGKWSSARYRALQARDAIANSGSGRTALAFRADLAATEAYMADVAHLGDAAFEFGRQYRDAIDRGLTLEAVRVAWRLCQFHRFANAPKRAVAALEDILPIARHVLCAEDRAEMCVGLASGYVACGEPANAHRMIAMAREDALPGGFMSGISYVIAADAYLLEGRYDQALRLAGVGLETMQRLGRGQSVGSALRIQAEAKHALGDARTAKGLIEDALANLAEVGLPYVIAKAHGSAARITGKHAHRRTADKILRDLRLGSSV